MAFKEISIDTLKINPFHKISKEWMLITAEIGRASCRERV